MQSLNQSQISFNPQGSTHISLKKQSTIKITHQCTGGNQLGLFCFNKNCKNINNFLCNDDQCQCYQKHQQCLKFHIKNVLKKINQKVGLNSTGLAQLKKQISLIFTDVINKISDDQEFIENNVQTNLRLIQLTDLQKGFYQIFVEQKVQKFKEFDGPKLASLWQINQNDKKGQQQIINKELIKKNCQNLQNYKKIFQKTVQKIKKDFSRILNAITEKIIHQEDTGSKSQIKKQFKFEDNQAIQLKQKIKKIHEQKQKQTKALKQQNNRLIKSIETFDIQLIEQRRNLSKYEQYINELNSKNNQLNQKVQNLLRFKSQKNQMQIKNKKLTEQLNNLQKQYQILYKKVNQVQSLHSTIITNKTQILNLISFFDRKLTKMNTVFKASMNDFDIKKYYQKCGHLKNTIILCQTNNNKIIGGYTPLAFNPANSNQDEWIIDNTNTSFLFSLTNNHKFELIQRQKAINRNANKLCIAFGDGFTFAVKNKANINEHSYFYLDFKTYVNTNYTNNEQSYMKLTGNSNRYFKVKEWEVLQVEFQ